jgi:hypothetical protein
MNGPRLFFAAGIVWISSAAVATDGYIPFEGEKTTWHAVAQGSEAGG